MSHCDDIHAPPSTVPTALQVYGLSYTGLHIATLPLRQPCFLWLYIAAMEQLGLFLRALPLPFAH